MTLTSSTLTILIALITAIIGPIVVEWAKTKFSNKKPKKDTLGESIDTDEKIDRQLEILMEELNCDRICIAQFHNGGHFYPTGKSIKKFSIFYERISDNTSSIKQTFQNIPVSLFPKVFSILYKEGELSIDSCKYNDIDCGLFPINGKDYKTKSFYMLSIKDLNNNFIGSLTISYYNKEHKFKLDEWILLRQKVGAIGTILTDYLHDKK
jgi:hypothetical protein